MATALAHHVHSRRLSLGVHLHHHVSHVGLQPHGLVDMCILQLIGAVVDVAGVGIVRAVGVEVEGHTAKARVGAANQAVLKIVVDRHL